MSFFDSDSFLIRGARVYDGRGGAAVFADVGVCFIAVLNAMRALGAAGKQK